MKQKRLGKIALFLTAILWGSTFAIGKIATEVFSSSFVIALRFTVAAIALFMTTIPLLRFLNKEYLMEGFWMGITLFASYLLQVAGLELDTSPGKSAFLCTTYCVMVPFFYWYATKKQPEMRHIICVFICLLGIGVVSLKGDIGMTTGDLLTVLSGIPGAMNIVISSIVCRKRNPLLLTAIELWVVAILAWIFVFVTDTLPKQYPMNAVGGVVYLGLVATALCLFLQSYGLKYSDASIGGMILSLESVFGVVFALIIYKDEVITLRMVVGFLIIFAAIVLSQWEKKEKVLDE